MAPASLVGPLRIRFSEVTDTAGAGFKGCADATSAAASAGDRALFHRAKSSMMPVYSSTSVAVACQQVTGQHTRAETRKLLCSTLGC